MTRFNSDEHWDALRACWDATDFLAIVTYHDIANLNRAAGSYACNEPGTLSRTAYANSLAAVRAAVDSAKAANPELVTSVFAAREAKRLASISLADAKKAEETAALRATAKAEKAAAEAILQEKIGFEKLALKLKTENPEKYAAAYTIARAECEKIPNNMRPRINVRIGQSLTA